MNGILVHGLDFDDTHSRGVIHATASSFPCALALADRDDADGETLLAAYVAAMEVATRLGVGRQGRLPSGRLPSDRTDRRVRLRARRGEASWSDPQRATMAQGIVLSMASGSLEFLEDGAWTKRLHPGWAGVAGITAATLAKHGFVGPRGAYDGRFGLYASHLGSHFAQADLTLATEALGRSWQIDEVAVKPIPGLPLRARRRRCRRRAARQIRLPAKDIRRVRVLVPQEVVKTVCEPVANKRNPANSYDAQFSIPYIVATGLLKGRFTLDELEAKALRDAAVLNLASRVDYAVDHASTFPRHYTGEVIVETRGRAQPASSRGGQSRLRRSAAEQRRGGRPSSSTTPNAPSRAEQPNASREAVLGLDRQNAARARRRPLRRALRSKQWTPSPTRSKPPRTSTLVLDMVDKFLATEVKPYVHALEHDDVYPAAIVEKMKEMGLFGCVIAPSTAASACRPRPTRKSSSASRRCGCRSAASSTRT